MNITQSCLFYTCTGSKDQHLNEVFGVKSFFLFYLFTHLPHHVAKNVYVKTQKPASFIGIDHAV